jgi:hypothetical protein
VDIELYFQSELAPKSSSFQSKPQAPVNGIPASPKTWEIINNGDHPEMKFIDLFQLHSDKKILPEKFGAALTHTVRNHQITPDGVEYLRQLMTDVHGFSRDIFTEEDWETIKGNRFYSSNGFKLAP